MRPFTCALLQGENADRALIADSIVAVGDDMLYGALHDREWTFHIPICAGFALVSETAVGVAKHSADNLREIERRLMEGRDDRFPLEAHKTWDPDLDRSWARLPFDPVVQAIVELTATIAGALPQGDTIVIVGCETGWFTEAIAARCPHHSIMSVMDPGHPALGFAGCRMWLGQQHRAGNSDIVFQVPGRPLPIRSGGAGLVIDLRPIDRTIPWPDTLADTLSLCRPDGIALIPRLGMTPDSEAAAVTTLARRSGVRLIQVPAGPPVPLRTLLDRQPAADSRGPAGGAMIFVGPDFQPRGSAAEGPQPPTGDRYMLVNPDWHLDLHCQTAVHETGSDPDVALTTAQCEMLYWASRAIPLDLAPSVTDYAREQCNEIVDELSQQGIVRPVETSDGMARLHCFRLNGEPLVPYNERVIGNVPNSYFGKRGDAQFAIMAENGERFSYADTHVATQNCMSVLHAIGLRKGDRIAVQSSLGIRTIQLFWAAVGIGAVFVPFDKDWAIADIEQVIEDSKPDLVFLDADLAGALSPTSHARYIMANNEEPEEWADRTARTAPENESRPAPAHSPTLAETIRPADLALILPTSGTTGRRKLVQLSQGALFRIAQVNANANGFCRDDKVLTIGNLHSMAGIRKLVACALAGSCQVFISPTPEGLLFRALQSCEDHSVTFLSLNPNTLRAICHAKPIVERLDLNSLRKINSGGDRLPSSVVQQYTGLLDIPLQEMFGATELSTVMTTDARNVGVIAEKGAVPISIIAQVVREDDTICDNDEVGALRLYADRRMDGYLDQPDLTSQILRKGWIYTGDLGSRSNEGRLRIVGRRRDMYRDVQGELSHPSELETILLRHDAISDVAVTSRANANDIDIAIAFIVLNPDRSLGASPIEELNDFIRDQIGRQKIPGKIIFVAELPRGENQKVQKSKLLARYADQLT